MEREGDPRRGLALAVYVGTSALAAAALSMLIEERIRSAGFDGAAAHSSSSGFIVSDLAETPDDVARFVRVANDALVSPVAPLEAERVAARWRTAPPRFTTSSSEAAVAQCSGDLVLGPDAESPATFVTELGSWLRRIGVGDVAFSVVGPREHLDAGADALNALAAWDRLGNAPTAQPQAQPFGVGPGVAGHLGLSVALSGPSPAAAIAAAERLADPGSLLAVRLGAAFPAWQVARVATHLSRRGTCLRVDLQSTGAAPSVAAVAATIANAFDEMEHTLARVRPGPWVVAKQVLAMDGPHQAAAVAAWQALSTPEQQGSSSLPSRRLAHYAGPLAPTPSPERIPQSLASRPKRSAGGVGLERGVEAGQGKFWMLLATPCGTGAEDVTTAGTLALALHASALGHSKRSGVEFEPWLHVDAMGILARSTAATPHESPAAQAERVAEALARALLSPGPDPLVVAKSRDFLLDSLAQGPTPSLSLALRQTSANHPSWLEARGTWSSLSTISTRSVQLERESFVRGKLRLATLGNHDDAQIDAGERRLISLLDSVGAGQRECPPRRPPASVAGKYRIEIAGSADVDAVISVPLPPSDWGLSEEAVWTEVLMNRTDGWLHQALMRPSLVSTARARAMGGAGAAALVIEIHAVDGKREEAVAQVRGLLERLRAGAATPVDARHARELLARREGQRQLDPRGRLVKMWHGSERPRATLESLRALHRVAFEAGREVVVLADSTE